MTEASAAAAEPQPKRRAPRTADLSEVPPMPDGRSASEHIAEIEALSRIVRTPMPNGGRMMWHVWGADSGRPPLVLFNGGAGSWLHWIRNVVPLSQHYTVYVGDVPGMGESDATESRRDIWQVTHAAKMGLETILPRDRRFDIAGFSFGGNLAGHVSTLLGDWLRSVVLVGAGGFRLSRKPGPPMTSFHREQLDAQGQVEAARRNLGILMLHDPASIDGVAIQMQILNSHRARTDSRAISRAGTLHDILPKITTRLAGIWGELDSTSYPYMSERYELLRAHQPGIDMREIKGAGHWVMYEAADAFNAALIDILAKTPG